jgi:hypothetical protein
MEREDRAREKRLAPAGARRHRAPDDAVSEHDARIALEEPVRDRRQEVERVERARDLGPRPLDPFHEARREAVGGQVVQGDEEGGRPREERRELREDRVPRGGLLEDLLEKIAGVEDLVGDELQDLPEPPVLLARARPEQDVVEQQVLHHRRHHPVDLAAGLVDENRPRRPISDSIARSMTERHGGRPGMLT